MPDHRSFYFEPPGDPGGHTVGAHVHVPELWPLVDSFYSAYRCEPGPGSQPSSEILLWREAATFWLRGPSGDWFADSPGEALAYFEAELTDALLARAGRWVSLHGSAVVSAAGPMALLGPSGSGKSTLSLGLCELHGFTLLTDDALLLDPDTGAAQPFERSLRVHRAGLAGLDLDPARLPGAGVVEPYVWIRPEEYAEGGRDPQPPLAFVFLDSGPGDPNAPERLGAAESLRRLLVARTRDDTEPASELDTLLDQSRTVPAFRLNVIDPRECVRHLSDLVVRWGGERRQSGVPLP